MRSVLGQTFSRLFRTVVRKTGQNRQLSSASELEETVRSLIQGYNHSEEDFAKNYCDDVTFLAPDEPIIKGKQVNRFAPTAAVAEWRGRGLAHYGTAKLLRQTNCDFIGDNTCVTVDLLETADDKGDKMQYKNLFVWTKIDGKWRVWRVMFNSAGQP